MCYPEPPPYWILEFKIAVPVTAADPYHANSDGDRGRGVGRWAVRPGLTA